MNGRKIIVVSALSLLVGPVWAQETAKPREEGRSSSSDVGARHHSSEGARSSSAAPSDSSSSSAPSSAFADPPTDAQRRHPRPGTGTGARRGTGSSTGRVYYGYPFSRYYYYGYYPYYPYYDYGYWGFYGGYYPYPYRNTYRDIGSIRMLVEPEETRVYVDGYYAGIVDDFNGIFQRLHLAPGRHEIALKLEGYRTHKVKVYVPVDHTIKIRHTMVRGTGEDPGEDVVGTPEPYEERRVAREERDDDRRSFDKEEPGTLRMSVRPEDASVYVDGEFRGGAREAHRLSLAPGTHRIEVVRPGYRTLEREVEIQAGRTVELDLELQRP